VPNLHEPVCRTDVALRIAALSAALSLTGLLIACGGGGDSSISGIGSNDPFVQRTADANPKAALCAEPRSGNDPYNSNKPYPDRQGSIDDEKSWVKAFMGDIYLWYRDIPSVNAAPYTVSNYGSVDDAMDAYFRALKTRKTTASGKLVDQFSFTYSTALFNSESRAGVATGYGMQVALLANTPPREAVVTFTDPNTPASNASIARGAEITAVDGVDLVNDDSQSGVDTLNAGLFPSAAGESHSFTLRDYGSSSDRTVSLTAIAADSQPVRDVQTYTAGSSKVGYLLFTQHIATAEGELINAITQLSQAGVSDLVLDMRYNGGGFLDIASELAYMIGGPARTANKTFEKLSFNDKNPLAGESSNVTPFYAKSQGFDSSVADNTALPTLNLSRLFVLTGAGTCSASEAVVNGLRGVGVNVVLIGNTTCGKPYGFYATDNCGLTYFAIEFAGVNDQGFGDYADGFAPTCQVDDDFSHALGDQNEALLAAALNYRTSSTCPTMSKVGTRQPMQLLRSPLQENLLIGKPR
jgi:carboxyl-terminal processing protease